MADRVHRWLLARVRVNATTFFAQHRCGRAMVVRSLDSGKTWSKPETLLDTPDDDIFPSFVELPDGTLVCSLFTYAGGDPPK